MGSVTLAAYGELARRRGKQPVGTIVLRPEELARLAGGRPDRLPTLASKQRRSSGGRSPSSRGDGRRRHAAGRNARRPRWGSGVVNVRRLGERVKGLRLQAGASILMYHAIGEADEPASRFVVPVRSFRRQMAWLGRCGYHVLSLDRLLRYLDEAERPPPRSVVITFDDGYVDNLALAAPVLGRFGFPATVFVATCEVGGVADWTPEPALNGRRLLSWEGLAALCASGSIDLGAHTRTHLSLRSSDLETARAEIEGSLEDLRGRGFSARSFAYPFGHSTPDTRAFVRDAGFASALGVQPGRARTDCDGYALPRYEIRGRDSLATFAFTLALGRRPPTLGGRRRT